MQNQEKYIDIENTKFEPVSKMKVKGVPYVKKYENGILTNPIVDAYLHAPNPFAQFANIKRIHGSNRRWEPSQSRFFKGKSAVRF